MPHADGVGPEITPNPDILAYWKALFWSSTSIRKADGSRIASGLRTGLGTAVTPALLGQLTSKIAAK
jgi:hypothetical protein